MKRILLVASLILTACSAPAAPVLPSAPDGTVLPVELTQPAGEAAPLEAVSINICYSTPSGAHVPLWYAYENGLFEKYGLDVNMLSFSSGSDAAVAMIADEVEICQIAGPAVMNAVVAGEDLALISSLYNVYLYSLMVAPEIQKPEDLIGKAVAVSDPGTATDVAVRKALESMGLVPDKDVSILSLGGEGDRVMALESGQVAGTVVVPPTTLKLREKGYREMMDLSEQGWPYMRLGYAARRAFIEENRPAALAFMRAIVEAIVLLKNDPDGAQAAMAKYLELDPEADKALLEEAYRQIVIKYLLDVPVISEQAVQAVLDEMKVENPQAASFSAQDFIDLSLLQELLDSGFLETLKPEN